MKRIFHELMREDILAFAMQAHVELHGCPLDDDMYLHLIAYDVERIVAAKRVRYVANLPPGSGKTFMLAEAGPAWILGHNPAARILIVSHSEDLATDISRTIRTILQAPSYRDAFPKTILAKDNRSVQEFATTAGGQVYARSLNGSVTGIHCDILIADDLVQIRDHGNRQHLQAVNARFDTELMTRLNNPERGWVIIVQQRLNPMDLSGHVQNRKGWIRRILALVATQDCDYRLKNGVWHRKAGEILRPKAFSAEYIAELRENLRAPGFGPLYQQAFSGPDVLQVRREHFVVQPFYAPPAVAYVLSVDLNHKGEVGQSYSVIQCWGLLPDAYLLYDLWRGRVHKSVFADQIRHMKQKYRPRVILIEDNGPALDLHAQFDTAGCPVYLIQPRDDKLTRFRRHLDLFRNGQVVLRAGAPFLNDFFDEHENFPYGDHDDQVDTEVQFFEWMSSNDLPPVRHLPPVMGALGSVRQARANLYWNAGRPTRYVFSRR
jgi:predicted phage terminase large subunit-like protein